MLDVDGVIVRPRDGRHWSTNLEKDLGISAATLQTYFFKHQFDEAASKLLLAIQDQPGYPHSYRVLAACYAHMGRLDEARAIVGRLRAVTPLVVLSDLPFRNPEDRELALSGLRLAAGEAT